VTATGNPFRIGLEIERTPAPCTFVVFGASGDLTRRKLLPALYNLAVSHLLPAGFSIVGFAVTELTEDAFRQSMHEGVAQFSRRKPLDEAVWQDFSSRLHYVSGSFDDPANFQKLRAKLEELDAKNGTRGNRLYYLAIPPSLFPVVNEQLAKAGLVADPSDTAKYSRIIVEKPFGHDLASGDALNAMLHRVFHERQIFRIDHYLGKETFASATPSSSPSGTATISTTFRSRSPRTSASRVAASSTKRPGPRATSCKTICCSC
jgi:glucose-6-phosphate 1-dehydrogenase